MSVFGPSIYRNSQRQYLGTLLWLQSAVAGISIVVAAIAATTYLRDDTGLLQKALLGMLISAPCVLLYWFARRAFYLQLRPGRAVGGAILYCALLSTTIWLLVRSGLLSAFTAFVAMGLAALTTSVVSVVPTPSNSSDAQELFRFAGCHPSTLALRTLGNTRFFIHLDTLERLLSRDRSLLRSSRSSEPSCLTQSRIARHSDALRLHPALSSSCVAC